MRAIILLIAMMMILSAAASAQVLVSVEEKTVCGDGIREGHEMCEPDTDQDLCEEAGKVIGIYMACDPRDCTCLPKRMDCGNEIREGVEYCDPGEKEDPEENDFCDELGEIFNETFTCDPDTCLCKPEKLYGVVPPDVCGDKNITGSEQCETDEDCEEGEICQDCICVLKVRQNITEVIEKFKEEPAPEEKKKEEGPMDYHDLVGTVLPSWLMDDFEEEKINVVVNMTDGSIKVVGVTTSHGVVQDIVDEKLDGATYDAFANQKLAEEILASDDKANMLKLAMDEEDITYKPKGLFARIWQWITGLFK
ncbi:hypothetical protein KY346_00435 [Candidatus Woesearchaeota archaeon]|nr:hypothetical protein [Candidatus Woesearchaeota archaeon]